MDKRDDNSTDEIEITPKMIRAGIKILRDRDAFDVFGDGTLETIVYEVFEAMAACRR